MDHDEFAKWWSYSRKQGIDNCPVEIQEELRAYKARMDHAAWERANPEKVRAREEYKKKIRKWREALEPASQGKPAEK